ncbi:MAG: hypothetical protein EZS28_016568 [Streblomastix strix]|uniref:Uncharacterized protein n=1 Tax=Streblomastix strix TaxID=222440 RepID=A0A5J4VZ92_9EUKA|nr:MAG: hypothetical protein EZS28_016568 [Streblomastix strix]
MWRKRDEDLESYQIRKQIEQKLREKGIFVPGEDNSFSGRLYDQSTNEDIEDDDDVDIDDEENEQSVEQDQQSQSETNELKNKQKDKKREKEKKQKKKEDMIKLLQLMNSANERQYKEIVELGKLYGNKQGTIDGSLDARKGKKNYPIRRRNEEKRT